MNTTHELDIPEFLLVRNRVPLSVEQKAALDLARAKAPPPPERKYAETERAYRASILRDKAIREAIAAPAREAFFAAKKAEAEEAKIVKAQAKANHKQAVKAFSGKRRRRSH